MKYLMVIIMSLMASSMVACSGSSDAFPRLPITPDNPNQGDKVKPAATLPPDMTYLGKETIAFDEAAIMTTTVKDEASAYDFVIEGNVLENIYVDSVEFKALGTCSKTQPYVQLIGLNQDGLEKTFDQVNEGATIEVDDSFTYVLRVMLFETTDCDSVSVEINLMH